MIKRDKRDKTDEKKEETKKEKNRVVHINVYFTFYTHVSMLILVLY